MDHIKSVPYTVSFRWLFYRLYQEGFYKDKKKGYQNCDKLLTRVRRHYWGGWNPLTLADDTRKMIIDEKHGYPPFKGDIKELINEQIEETKEKYEDLQYEYENFECTFTYRVDSNYLHEYYIVIAFEARAMIGQFRHYTDNLTLIPCGGQPSIPYRYKVAKYVSEKAKYYGKPGLILYYGDCDEAGERIYDSFADDMKAWGNNLEIVFCGLTREQVDEMGIEEDVDKRGKYQWEALNDEQARTIISASLQKYKHDLKAEEKAEKISKEITDSVCNAVNDALGF